MSNYIIFSLKGQLLSNEESLFTYPNGQSFADFSNESHVPIFLSDIDTALREEGARICGGSDRIQCIFDYSQTRNMELAIDTQSTMEENELGRRIESEFYQWKLKFDLVFVDNLPPVIEASDTFEITVGETATYTLNITDPGDTFNVTVIVKGMFTYTIERIGSIWILRVTINFFIKFSFSVVATDSLNATSVVTPQV